jgi:hypothetical protein
MFLLTVRRLAKQANKQMEIASEVEIQSFETRRSKLWFLVILNFVGAVW